MWLFVALPALALIVLLWMAWTFERGAPWVPSPMNAVRSMLNIAEVGPDDVVYDLGCGDGRMIVTAAKEYGARAVGVEIDPLRYLWCQVRIALMGLQDRVRVVRGDLFEQDLSDATVVTCYLLQSTNDELEEKLMQELSPNARVVSSAFTFSGMHLIFENKPAKLYLYNPHQASESQNE